MSVNWLAECRAQMLEEEKLLLYALVRGLKPQSVLEIGVFEGGSSAIILHALDENQSGQLYSIDPVPQVYCSDERSSRWHFVKGHSPEAIGRIVTDLRDVAPFDFVLIDGGHTKQEVIADVEGVLPYLTDEAWLLFHDAFTPGVEDAIEYEIGAYPSGGYVLSDCGMLCNTFVYLEHMRANYYGMRLLRFERG